MSAFYDLQMTTIHGDPVDFSQFRGQVCLIVNLASE